MKKVISLGLGLQSSTLYFMSSLEIIERADVAIFADPMRESKETYRYKELLLKWAKENKGIPIITGVYGDLYNDIMNANGKRVAQLPLYSLEGNMKGLLLRQCTYEYKVLAVRRAYKNWLGLGKRDRYPDTEMWIGITIDEASRMKDSKDKWQTNRYPLIEKGMDRADCAVWLHSYMIDRPPKSACTFCPYQSDRRWLNLKRNNPEEFESACLLDDKIRINPKLRSKLYLHRSFKPLREANLQENQLDAFDNECEGYCGI